MELILTSFLTISCYGQPNDLKAKTEDGKEVLLRTDGTWSFVGEYKKKKNAPLFYKGQSGLFAFYLTPGKWKKAEKNENEASEASFFYSNGDMQAMVIAERIQIPVNILKKAALENMRQSAKDAKITFEEKRVVNGQDVLCLTLEATPDGIPVIYHGYYYSGDEGSIQVITFTGKNLFKEFKPEMENFLNSFEIIKKDD